MPLDYNAPSQEVLELREALKDDSEELVVVGATSHQVHNLMRAGTISHGRAVESLFDLVIIDEGSQLDMANAIVTLAALHPDASVICAGDPLQLPPVMQAEPPLGLEHMVGSIYLFLRHVHGIEESKLQINYRSNADIVNFCR